jgi:hypothetical protein
VNGRQADHPNRTTATTRHGATVGATADEIGRRDAAACGTRRKGGVMKALKITAAVAVVVVLVGVVTSLWRHRHADAASA